MESKGSLDHQVRREPLEIKVRLEHPGHQLDQPEEQGQAGQDGLVDQADLIDQAWVAGLILILRMVQMMARGLQADLDCQGLPYHLVVQAALGIHQTAAPQLNQLC